MEGKTYYEDDRQRIRGTLTNEQHAYVIALENIACKAYHAEKTLAPQNDHEREVSGDLYDALSVVDFMNEDELRDK